MTRYRLTEAPDDEQPDLGLAPATPAATWSDWTIPPGYEPLETARCRGQTCGAIVLWCRTRKGKRSPMDRDGTPHWATCPNVARFRRR